MRRIPLDLGEDLGRDPVDDRVLALHAAVSAGTGFLVTLLWGLTGAGRFWPVWVWFGLAVLFGINLSWWYARRFRTNRRTALVLHLGLTVVAVAVLLAVWALSGGGAFWPGVPVLCLAGLAACHFLVSENWQRLFAGDRERELAARVGQLERTRQDALEAQAVQLRQVERDLHDGAQSRLIALSMQLARAEAKLESGEAAAPLVRGAREEAALAITDLRSLVKGIAPPVLIDRGLVEATRSLAGSSTGRVTIDAEVDRRLPSVVETAAYFVIAESLTNAAKHAPGSPVDIRIRTRTGTLEIAIRDTGPGGADPSGGGMRGLRQRVEALDGEIEVHSPVGEGTAIEVTLPCA